MIDLRLFTPRYPNFETYEGREPAADALRASSYESGLMTAASQETLDTLAIVHQALLKAEQIDIGNGHQVLVHTDHILHGGLYSRTIRLGPGVVMMGSLIKRATILIVNGNASVLAGNGRRELEGYNVVPGSAGRKQLFVTRGPVEMTMIYPTQAQTVEEAENEIFAEADQLTSRKDSSGDTVTITGE